MSQNSQNSQKLWDINRPPKLDQRTRLIIKSFSSSGFCEFRGVLSENERKRKNIQIPGFYSRAEKAVEIDVDSNCSWCSLNGPQRPGKENVGTEDQKKDRNQRSKIKEMRKIYKYLGFARELKSCGTWRQSLPIVNETLERVSVNLKKRQWTAELRKNRVVKIS